MLLSASNKRDLNPVSLGLSQLFTVDAKLSVAFTIHISGVIATRGGNRNCDTSKH